MKRTNHDNNVILWLDQRIQFLYFVILWLDW